MLFFYLTTNNHHFWALAVLSDLKHRMSMHARFLTSLTIIKVLTNNTFVSNSDDRCDFTSTTPSTFMLSELLNFVDWLMFLVFFNFVFFLENLWNTSLKLCLNQISYNLCWHTFCLCHFSRCIFYTNHWGF